MRYCWWNKLILYTNLKTLWKLYFLPSLFSFLFFLIWTLQTQNMYHDIPKKMVLMCRAIIKLLQIRQNTIIIHQREIIILILEKRGINRKKDSCNIWESFLCYFLWFISILFCIVISLPLKMSNNNKIQENIIKIASIFSQNM